MLYSFAFKMMEYESHGSFMRTCCPNFSLSINRQTYSFYRLIGEAMC